MLLSRLGYEEARMIDSSSPETSNHELVYDGIRIRNFIVTTETIYHSDGENYNSGDIRPIGTICHEIGHVLGLPDLYDTSESSAPGIGDWGLMGTGNWNNVGTIYKDDLGWVVYNKNGDFTGTREIPESFPKKTNVENPFDGIF